MFCSYTAGQEKCLDFAHALCGLKFMQGYYWGIATGHFSLIPRTLAKFVLATAKTKWPNQQINHCFIWWVFTLFLLVYLFIYLLLATIWLILQCAVKTSYAPGTFLRVKCWNFPELYVKHKGDEQENPKLQFPKGQQMDLFWMLTPKCWLEYHHHCGWHQASFHSWGSAYRSALVLSSSRTSIFPIHPGTSGEWIIDGMSVSLWVVLKFIFPYEQQSASN